MNRTRGWQNTVFNLSAPVAEYTNTTQWRMHWSPIRHPEEVDFPPELLPPRGGRALPEARGKYSARFLAQLDADGRGGGWDGALSGTEIMAVAPRWMVSDFHSMGRSGGLCMDPKTHVRPYAYTAHLVFSSNIYEDRKHALMTLGLWQYNASFMNPHTALHGLYFPKNGSVRPAARLVGIAGAVKCDNVSHFINETVALLKLAAKHTGRRPILPWIDCASPWLSRRKPPVPELVRRNYSEPVLVRHQVGDDLVVRQVVDDGGVYVSLEEGRMKCSLKLAAMLNLHGHIHRALYHHGGCRTHLMFLFPKEVEHLQESVPGISSATMGTASFASTADFEAEAHHHAHADILWLLPGTAVAGANLTASFFYPVCVNY
jgi:hypothetical protein